jgi:ATP-dependent Clp protease ATP-binding subunit ClpC
MPKINVYLSDELAEAVKEAGLPVSPICQQALEFAVRKVTAIRETAKLDVLRFTYDDPTGRLEHFTARSRTAVANAVRRARDSGLSRMRTEHLLLGILDEGGNLAVQVLRSLEIEPDDLREDLDARSSVGDEVPQDPPQPDDAAAEALQAALAESISMGHNYIGCEHLLLGLVVEAHGVAGEVLRSRGVDARIARRTVSAALGGFMRGQAQQKDTRTEGAGALREVLSKLGQRLDALEQAVASLKEGGPSTPNAG